MISIEEKLSKEDISGAFRQACWDLYVANLPDPVISFNDSEDKDNKDGEGEAVPRGFSINPETWEMRFNASDIPKQIDGKEGLIAYARSICHHELSHYTKAPSDAVTEAILMDSALKGFSQEILNDAERASDYSHLAVNIFCDLVIDTFLAKEGYGREDFSDLTLFRQKETVKDARDTEQTPSLLWQCIVSAYEHLWNEKLGLDEYISQRNRTAENAAVNLVKILGNDWKNRETWEDKVRKFAKELEPLIRQSEQEAKSQLRISRYSGRGEADGNNGIPVPDDIVAQIGTPFSSQLDKSAEDKDIGEDILAAIYERNKNNPEKFAGTMSALSKIEADDALMLMYRARARELLIEIRQKENLRKERSPSYLKSWNIGDPLVGKNGLEIIPSMLASGKPVPGITTYRRNMEPSEGYEKMRMIPDLLIVIDSSGTMSWSPWENNVEQRGDFDKAILGAEGAALYAIDNGGRVAVINFSGPEDITSQEFATDISKVEKAVMHHYDGGTVVPVKQVREMLRKTDNPLLTLLLSDCLISNYKEACDNAFSHAISPNDTLAVFKIGADGSDFAGMISGKGAMIYRIDKIEDLAGIMIGKVKETYKEAAEK